MKHSLLYLFLALLSVPGFSQTLEFKYDDHILDKGDELTVVADADSDPMSFTGLEIKNKSLDPVLIRVAREVTSQVTDTENSFYWGKSYSPETDTSTLSVKIDGGETTAEFAGYYSPNGNAGTTTVKYIFYDLGDPENQFYFTVHYQAVTNSGISDNAGLQFTPVYPNPANNEARFDFSFKRNPEEVKFVILNLLGNKVKEIEIHDPDGSLRLNTSGLTEGIYFYSLLVNNESVLTHKLIIKH